MYLKLSVPYHMVVMRLVSLLYRNWKFKLFEYNPPRIGPILDMYLNLTFNLFNALIWLLCRFYLLK